MPNRSTLLSFEIRNIREYEDSICSFSFLNSQKVYDDVDSDSSVARLYGNVYDSKIVALCGINASGKTTLLSMIRFMLSVYLSNKPLDSFQSLLQRLHGSQDIEISAIFAVGGAVYKIDSAISKDDRDSFSFRDETLYELKGKISRQAISDEAMYKIVQTRNTLPEDAKLFLDKGKSIASMVQDKNDNSLLAFYSDDTESELRRFLRIQPEIIRYLDRSISSIDINSNSMMYTVRRVGQDPIEVNYKELLEILSSGTKRGIGFFSDMLAVLRYGGYLLVDELEGRIDFLAFRKQIQTFFEILVHCIRHTLSSSVEINFNYRNTENNFQEKKGGPSKSFCPFGLQKMLFFFLASISLTEAFLFRSRNDRNRHFFVSLFDSRTMWKGLAGQGLL